jgi:hypothetical protein
LGLFFFTAEDAEDAEKRQLQELFQKHLQLNFLCVLCVLCVLCGKKTVSPSGDVAEVGGQLDDERWSRIGLPLEPVGDDLGSFRDPG